MKNLIGYVRLAVVLDTRRIKTKTNKYPVKLRVTYEREVQFYSTIYDLTQDEYNTLAAPRMLDKMKKIRDDLKQIQRNAEDVAFVGTKFLFGRLIAQKECHLFKKIDDMTD